ncbi:Crossover junction endodeoxyribonuclease RuvC [invertebrate metagenome]|uniref:Crossover junction endodeoxyribonuclease RuvC n=1 Tax=invertebrate metagenome TaxID=1711999 RepID=A0A484H620_9ZZZZ
MRLLGLDPGLRRTGWGIIESDGHQLHYVAAGVICVKEHFSLAERLVQIHDGVTATIAHHRPDEAAVEAAFVSRHNPVSTLKLGQARGVILLVPARAGLSVSEYEPNLIKKAVVGTGHATKCQVALMVYRLLLGCQRHNTDDAADALAVAICHAHSRATAAGRKGSACCHKRR